MSSQHNLNYSVKYNLKFSSELHVAPSSSLSLEATGKGEKSGFFFQWSDIGYISHMLGQVPWSGVIGQHKSNPMFCLTF